MRALAVVAHPDDCILFALGIIQRTPQWSWEIVYLTYDRDSERGQEIASFWERRGIATHWLGYNDDWHDIQRGEPSFDVDQACSDIAQLIRGYGVVVTHDANGDYGHPHHRFVHRCVAENHTTVITFSPFGKGNLYIELPDNLYSLDEIPQHASLGDFISPVNRRNEYQVPEHIKSLILESGQ